MDTDTDLRPAGYAALAERYGIEVIPNWHRSVVATRGTRRTHSVGGVVEEVYPPGYWPGDSSGAHLEFALKYDGTNLAILTRIFEVMPADDLLDYIRSRPTGKYARRLWFLYEYLTAKRLPLDDLERGNYVDLLDADRYYAITPARKVRRQRINDNLPGDAQFCPTIRRTDTLRDFEAADLPGRCEQVVAAYSPELLKRALSYLYTRETKSSFELEHIEPGSRRTERFVALLRLAEREDFCDQGHLIELHNRIVDPRFEASDYRATQNYVGESVAWGRERVHFAAPRPEDIPDLMTGLIAAHHRMEEGGVSAVVHAAAVSYGFVFLHPFGDGNGRIHRFLIHNILARRGFTPGGIMFPVSAVMLKDAAAYDASLEAFSRPLMPLIEYTLDEEGRMTVLNDTANWYRYPDMTPQAEALFRFIERTIDTELVQELLFLQRYDATKKAIREIVDMPDREIDLFIRFSLQNQGRLSARKRASHFAFLSDREMERLEEAVREGYGEEAIVGVQRGLESMRAGRGKPLDEAFDSLRDKLDGS